MPRTLKLSAMLGALIGIALAALSIYDMLHYEGDWFSPSLFDSAIFPATILLEAMILAGMNPPNLPRLPMLCILVSANACLFAVLFLVLGAIVHLLLSHLKRTNVAGGTR